MKPNVQIHIYVFIPAHKPTTSMYRALKTHTHTCTYTYTSWHYAATVPWDILLNFLQGSHQDYHAWSKQTRAGKLPGLMLLLNHLQKDVSSMTRGTDGVSYLAPSSSGSNQVQQQTLLTIPSAACFDMTQGNWLDLNTCMAFNVLTESYN